MSSTSTPERQMRQHDRADLDVYVTKIVDEVLDLARVRDISESGVYLYDLGKPVAEQSHIGLELQLPDCEDVIWVAGNVVREDSDFGGGVAVHFTRMAHAHRELIREFVERTT
ncbi:PilZ domain-containing protein [Myxococcota bacterium]